MGTIPAWEYVVNKAIKRMKKVVILFIFIIYIFSYIPIEILTFINIKY